MLRVVLAYVGTLLLVVGLLMLSVPLTNLLVGEGVSRPFLFTGSFCVALGLPTALWARRRTLAESAIGATAGYVVAWFAISLIAAIPLKLELGVGYVSALFETISGFTGTGMTTLRGLDGMERGVLLWRALMQWVGELGFAVFAMVLVPFFWRYGALLYNLERPVRIHASIYRTARRLLGVYLFFTMVGIVALYYAGAGFFDALTHSMTAIATGGMSNYDRGFEHLYSQAPLTVIPLLALMTLGGMSLITLCEFFELRFRDALRNEELKVYLILTTALGAVSAVLLGLRGAGQGPASYGFFNALSGTTTTGFSLGEVRSFDPALKGLLMAGMFVGGMTFSTAGGLKVARLIIIAKKLKDYCRVMLIGEKTTGGVMVNSKLLEEPEVSGALLYALIHAGAITIGSLLVKASMPEADLIDALFETTSAASCVGLSTGIATPEAASTVKAILMVLMLLGKLEYTPLLLVLGLIFHRRVIRMLK